MNEQDVKAACLALEALFEENMAQALALEGAPMPRRTKAFDSLTDDGLKAASRLASELSFSLSLSPEQQLQYDPAS